MMKTAFWTDSDNGIVVLRLALGITFFLHGWHKVTHGIDNQISVLVANGIPGFLHVFSDTFPKCLRRFS